MILHTHTHPSPSLPPHKNPVQPKQCQCDLRKTKCYTNAFIFLSSPRHKSFYNGNCVRHWLRLSGERTAVSKRWTVSADSSFEFDWTCMRNDSFNSRRKFRHLDLSTILAYSPFTLTESTEWSLHLGSMTNPLACQVQVKEVLTTHARAHTHTHTHTHTLFTLAWYALIIIHLDNIERKKEKKKTYIPHKKYATKKKYE